MCVEYEIRFAKCWHQLIRPDLMFWCPVKIASQNANMEADNSPCQYFEKSEKTFPFYCHQCMLSAVTSNTGTPEGLIDEGFPEPGEIQRSEAERILSIAHSTAGSADPTYHDGMTQIAHKYERTNIQLFQGFLSGKDFIWLSGIVLDVSAAIWKRWKSDDQPNPTLEEVALLVQIREAYIGSVIQYNYDLANWIVRAEKILNEPDSRVKVLARLPEITTSVSIASLGEETTCQICHEIYGGTEGEKDVAGELPVRLPCGHVIGILCLETWVQQAPDPLRICTLCNESFGIVQPVYRYPGDDDPPSVLSLVIAAGLVPDHYLVPGRSEMDVCLLALHPHEGVISPWYIRLLQGTGEVRLLP